MKLRTVLSVFAVALIPMFGGFTQGCAVEDQTSQSDNITQMSDYTVDIDAANALWSPAIPAEKPADLWTAFVKVGDQTIPAPIHLFGDVVNIIPYSNEDNVKFADGSVMERGDQEIAKIYKPGDIGIALKMHRPEHRLVDLNNADPSSMKEDFKLQDTHIEVVVGVEKAEHGKAGAITMNNPQSYEEGHFGDPRYSMIFFRPRLPDYVPADLEAAYKANTVLALTGFNAATDFPGDYNGGDPLGAKDPDKLRTYVDQMVRAIAGDPDAKAWFQEDANLVYCAELAYISLSAGVIAPLTKSFMAPRVGEDVWKKFVEQVEIHNRGVDEFQATGNISPENSSNFLSFNDNKRVGMVRLTLPPDNLRPVAELSPNPDVDAQKMAFKPLTMSDIVGEFMRTHIPRETLGEQLAPVQGAVLAKMKPGLFETMGMDQMPDTDPRKVAVNALFDQIVEAVSKSYGSYDEFQQAIAPLMEKAAQVTGPRPGDESGTGLFFPPSGFHVVAQGHHLGGLLKLDYEGHGAHASIVKKIATEQPEPVPPASDELTHAGTCQDTCGGQSSNGACWCDEACSQYGDCCQGEKGYEAVCR